MRRSRVTLNLHRDRVGFFEWWRMMQAFWCQSVVVSEPCFEHPVFRAGEHFLAVDWQEIPECVRWLARAPDGLRQGEQLRAAAHHQLLSWGTARRAGRKLLQFLERC
jgi:hypothetical protein